MDKIFGIYNNDKYMQLIKDCKYSFINDDKFIYTYIEILYIHINKLLNNSDDYQKLNDIKNKIDNITCLLLILSFFKENNFILGEANQKDIDIYKTIISILKLVKSKDEKFEKIRALLITVNNDDIIKAILNTPELQIQNQDQDSTNYSKITNEDFLKKLKELAKEEGDDKIKEEEKEEEQVKIERIKIIFQIKIMHDLFMLDGKAIESIKKI